MGIAAEKIPVERIEDRVKYFYGICHNKIRAKSGDTTYRTFQQVQKYFLKQPRGSGYHNESLLREFCRKYPKQLLIRAIDIAFSQGRHNYWEAVCEALEDIVGENSIDS